MGKNIIIFGADMSSSVHVDNKGKDILILGEGLTQGLDDTTLTVEANIPLNLYNQIEDLYLVYTIMEATLSYLLMLQKMYQFKANDSEIKKYTLCLGNVSKDFTINNMKKTGLKRSVKFFSLDYRSINTNGVLDIRKYLMKELL